MNTRNQTCDQPGISTKRIILTPYSDEYFDHIYAWNTDARWKHLWTNNRTFSDKKTFHDSLMSSLKSYYHDYMVIFSKNSPIPKGFICTYNYSSDGFLFFTVFVDQTYRNSYISCESVIIFHDFIFRHYPIRKIYCDVYSYNDVSIKVLRHSGYIIEGIFKHHRFYAGKYHDLVTFAIYRDVFYKIYTDMLNSLVDNH